MWDYAVIGNDGGSHDVLTHSFRLPGSLSVQRRKADVLLLRTEVVKLLNEVLHG